MAYLLLFLTITALLVENEVVIRQLKALKNKKAAAANAKLAKKVAKQLDEAQMKEVPFCCFILAISLILVLYSVDGAARADQHLQS